MRELLNNKKSISYIGLIFVVLVWGASPLASKYFLNYYSPAFGVAWGSLLSAILLAIMFREKLKEIKFDYFKVAIPLGVCYTSADLMQKIGLQYTTPTVYAFLENLSCVVVPFLTWFFIKKKPAVLQIVGSIICLVSAFVLSGLGSGDGGFSLGIGSILCGLAGIFYGVNIAGTGAFTKKFDSALYIMILLAIESIFSFMVAIAFHFIEIDGAPIEIIRFSWNPWLLLSRIAIVLISSTLCWVIRTSSMKHVDATVVAVMMPFSSIISGVLSVLTGMEELTSNLVWGAILGFIAMIVCTFGDMHSNKSKKQKKEFL